MFKVYINFFYVIIFARLTFALRAHIFYQYLSFFLSINMGATVTLVLDALQHLKTDNVQALITATYFKGTTHARIICCRSKNIY